MPHLIAARSHAEKFRRNHTEVSRTIEQLVASRVEARDGPTFYDGGGDWWARMLMPTAVRARDHAEEFRDWVISKFPRDCRERTRVDTLMSLASHLYNTRNDWHQTGAYSRPPPAACGGAGAAPVQRSGGGGGAGRAAPVAPPRVTVIQHAPCHTCKDNSGSHTDKNCPLYTS